MRVVLTKNSRQPSRSCGRAVRLEAEIVHRVETRLVDRLQAVSHVRQGAGDDHAHRVGEERVLYLSLWS